MLRIDNGGNATLASGHIGSHPPLHGRHILASASVKPLNCTLMASVALFKILVTISFQIDLPIIISTISKDKLNVLGKAHLSPGK